MRAAIGCVGTQRSARRIVPHQMACALQWPHLSAPWTAVDPLRTDSRESAMGHSLMLPRGNAGWLVCSDQECTASRDLAFRPGPTTASVLSTEAAMRVAAPHGPLSPGSAG